MDKINYLERILSSYKDKRGWRNYGYLKDNIIHNLELINSNNIILSKSDLKQLENKFCAGKSRSILVDSLYFKSYDVLSVLTEKHVLYDKFVIRALDIIINYKNISKEKEFNFQWIFNLKKHGFKFSDDIKNKLTYIGFDINLLEKIQDNVQGNFEIDIIKKICNFKNVDEFVMDIENLTKSNKIILTENILLSYYKAIPNIYFNDNYYDHLKRSVITDLINIYKLFIKLEYKLTDNDMLSFFDILNQLLNKSVTVHGPQYLVHLPINKINELLLIFNDNNIFANKDMILLLLNASFTKIKQNCEFYISPNYTHYYVSIFHNIIETLKKNKNNKIPKLNYIEYLLYNENYNYYYDKTILNSTLELLLDNELLLINNIVISRLFISNNLQFLEILLNKKVIDYSNELLRIASRYGNIKFIQLLIDNKIIPTFEDIKYIGPTNYYYEILNIFIEGGLLVNEKLLEYLVSINKKLPNIEKYNLDNSDLLERFCIKHRKFPYSFPEYQNIFSSLREKISILDLEKIIDKFDEEYKQISLFEHFIELENMDILLYLKNKFPNIKISKKSIYKTKNYKIYLEIFS